MFVEFTAVVWDTEIYFNGGRYQTYVSTDLISRVQTSDLERWLERFGDDPLVGYRFGEQDRRRDFVGHRYTDIIFVSAQGGRPDRITVEGAVEDVLSRIEFRS